MLMKQLQTSPTSDSAAETVQCHAVLAGSELTAFHPEQLRLPVASQLPGFPAPDVVELQAATKHTHVYTLR